MTEEQKPTKEDVLGNFHEEVAELRKGRPSMKGLRKIQNKYLADNPELTADDLDISPKGSVKDERTNRMPGRY